MIDVRELYFKIDIDTKGVNKALAVMQLLREELSTQLSLSIFSKGQFDHFLPSAKSSMSRNEFGELLITNFLPIFDAAYIKHCLKALKVRVLPNEAVRH